MRATTGRIGLLAVVALAGAPAQSHAGTAQLFGGYSYTRNGGQSYHGGNAALSVDLGPRFGLTLDVAGHRSSVDDVDLSLFSYMAGPHLVLTSGKTRLFVHALGGRVRSKASFSPVGGVEISESVTDFGVLLGGGVDHRLSERLALRLGADYYGVNATPDWQSQPRASLGLVYRFGSSAK